MNSTATMASSSTACRLTWTLFVLSLLLLATTNAATDRDPLLQCPNHTLFKRHAASTHTRTCPVPGLLGIFPDLNSDSNTSTDSINLPWSFPPKCMAISTSSSSSSPSSSSPAPSTSSSAGSDTYATMSFSSSSSFVGASRPPTDKDDRSRPSTNEEVYCLFTSQEFHNGQGISLVVSPNTAANLLGMGVFNDAPAAWKWTGATSGYSHARKTLDKPYRITDVKGKRKGVVATRPISQGEIIMVDVPALLLSEEFLSETGREGKGHLKRRMVKWGFEQLPESSRRKVMGLQRGPGNYEIDAILGINLKELGGDRFGTDSALALLEDSGTGEDYEAEELMGLFAEVARINHSCRPNARLRFSKRRLTIEVISYRPISPGEEIFISYTPLTLSPSDRHHFLKQNHHFACHCPLCTSLSDDPSANTLAAESHSRRLHLQELFNTMLHAKSEGFRQDAINILKDWLDFAEVEGLMPLMGEYHGIMAELYLLLAERGSPGDKEVDREGALRQALREARMAVDAWVKLRSVDGRKTEEARVFLEKVFKLKERRGKGNDSFMKRVWRSER